MIKRVKLPKAKKGLGLDVEYTPGAGLAGRFIIPPFSVIHAMVGGWMKRKRQWISLGIQSEIGRGEEPIRSGKIKNSDCCRNQKKLNGLTFRATGFMAEIMESRGGGTSIFDPALCEVLYSWFCPAGGCIVDPFSGGSVRGVVAVYMGFQYWGVDLRQEQVDANKQQSISIFKSSKNKPIWICGDSNRVIKDAPLCDFIFSCPPYGDLETYSNLPQDISNMDYGTFLKTYEIIIKKSVACLKDNRFACFVVGNYRDKRGFYHDLAGDTVRAFEKAGASYYNEIIYVTPAGSLPIRAGKQFTSGRKIGKTHQNILVFYKGDPKKIKDIFNSEV